MKRQYHVVVECINPKTGEVLPGRDHVRMTAAPVSHQEGCAILRKLSDYPWRRVRLLEV